MSNQHHFWLGRSTAPDALAAATDQTKPQDSHGPTDRARETIQDLKAGRVPRQVVRDLGEAVREADRNHGVGDAIGRSLNRVDGGTIV